MFLTALVNVVSISSHLFASHCFGVKAGVHVWVKDIQKLTNLTNRSFPESAAEEIHFWSSIGEALEMTNTELRWDSGDRAGVHFDWSSTAPFEGVQAFLFQCQVQCPNVSRATSDIRVRVGFTCGCSVTGGLVCIGLGGEA